MKRILCILALAIGVGAATYYVDPAAAGANNGTSWPNAWTMIDSTQDRAAAVAAGDTVLCRGTQVLSTAIEFKSNSGSATGEYIVYIGCNAAGNIDGTMFTIDGNGAATRCCSTWTAAYLTFNNIRFTGATNDNIDLSTNGGGDNMMFNNCWIDSAGDDGISGTTSSTNDIFFRCKIFGNDGWGILQVGAPMFINLCNFYDNSLGNFNGNANGNSFLFDNVFAPVAAGKTSLETIAAASVIKGNVIDGSGIANDTGLAITAGNIFVIFNRFTNLALGIDGEGASGNRPWISGYNYFADNTDDTSDVDQMINISDTTNTNTNVYGISGDGYIDDANGNYNLSAGAVGRRLLVKLNNSKKP
jgi:hypothetical protein